MANLEHQPDVEAEDDEDEAGYGVTAELVQTVRGLLESGQTENLRTVIAELHAADVAESVLFLVSPAAASITGAVLDVWGGNFVAIRS